MNENLNILQKKLAHLSKIQADVQHSIGKMAGPLAIIQKGDASALSLDARETISAFTTRFATYQEQLGKAMKSVAIEEESATSPFGAVLALMEKLGILDDPEQWKLVRELRNSVNHEYEDDPSELHQILSGMTASVPWLCVVHERLIAFVKANYA